MTKAPERIWMDPDIKFPECEKQYECDVRAEMLKGQTMSDNTDDMNDFVLLAMARDEAVSRVKELEAKLAAADKLAEALRVIESHRRKCHEYDADVGDELRSFDEEDVILMEWQARTALAAYQATKEGE